MKSGMTRYEAENRNMMEELANATDSIRADMDRTVPGRVARQKPFRTLQRIGSIRPNDWVQILGL